MGDLRLSKKHGVNPSVSICFWCGKDDAVILCGRLKGDVEAPRSCVFSYDPCPECKEQFSQGVWIIEASTEPTTRGAQEIQEGVYPTGRMVVVTEEFVTREFPNVFGEDVDVSDILNRRKMFLEDKVFDWMFGESLKKDANA